MPRTMQRVFIKLCQGLNQYTITVKRTPYEESKSIYFPGRGRRIPGSRPDERQEPSRSDGPAHQTDTGRMSPQRVWTMLTN